MAIHEEIVQVLLQQDASYARPMPSWELARLLNVAPSYVREQVGVLRRHRLVSVRRGRGGGTT
ncbi:MAG: Rrf2 family transcriptional regulator [Limnochordaceae bacterium]|nr:Rrf2 family transcriptional regulator [Limnochordaceae bacterium]